MLHAKVKIRSTAAAADGWALVGALLDVVTADAAFPVLSAVTGVTVVSSRVAERDQLLVCLLRPPNGTGSPRWLPSTLSVFLDVTLRLRLSLRCPTNASVTQEVVVVVPSPGQAAILAAEVKAASVASQYASWVGAPAAGSAVGRLSAVRSLVLCSVDASVGGMLPLRAALDCDASNRAADARGAVLGNAVLWATGCALIALLACGYSVRPYTTLFSHVHTMFSLSLSAVSVWCQVWYLFASARDGADLDALSALVAVSAVCDIVVSAASMLKALMDAVETLGVSRRHVDVLMGREHSRRGAVFGDEAFEAWSTLLTLAEGEDARTDVESLPGEYHDGDASVVGAGVSTTLEDTVQQVHHDAHFWRSDGSAAVDGDTSAPDAAVGVSTALEQRRHGRAHDLLLHFGNRASLE